MKKVKHLFIILFLLFLSVPVFTLNGCSSREKTPIVTIGDKKLYLEDFMYDIYLIEAEGNKLNENYLKTLGYSYWDYEFNGVTMRESAKDSVITRVIMNEILSDQASKNGLTLTDQELKDNQASVDTLIDSIKVDNLTKMGLSRELLIKAYNKISLGDQFYIQLAKNFQIDKEAIRAGISSDKYREYKTECLYIPTVSTMNQEITPFSDEACSAAYEDISVALEKVKNGTDFDTIANGDKKLTKYTRDFVFSKTNYEKEYQAAAVLLENDKYSEIITTTFGYYIIHMLDNNSNAQYEAAVNDAIKAEENNQFAAAYSRLKEQYDITVNFDYWDTVTLGSITTGENK